MTKPSAATSQDPDPRIAELLDYWFEGDPADCESPEKLMKKWFSGTPEQDLEIEHRFRATAEAAANGRLDSWSETPRGRLALILLLDQLPRSLHRGTAAAFAQDDKALELCLDGLDLGQDRALHPLARIFFCMPLQHAESPEIQERSITVFERLAASKSAAKLRGVLRGTANYAREHHDIVARFGRFPHRNRILERESAPEEAEFLRSGGPTYGQ